MGAIARDAMLKVFDWSAYPGPQHQVAASRRVLRADGHWR